MVMSESTPSPVDTLPGSAVAVVSSVVLDTDDPRRLADFYAGLLGWQLGNVEEDWVDIAPSPGPAGWSAGVSRLAFQLVINYAPPTWPSQTVPQQFHLDLRVADLDEGERAAVALGASRVSPAGEEGNSRVFLDPSGHPFCLTQAANWG